jgi:hypothetical protein
MIVPTELRGLDGRSMELCSAPGTCADIDGDRLCRAPATLYYVRPGRRVLSIGIGDTQYTVGRCYCDRHGGVERALAELAHRWEVLAPLSVDDYLAAGTATLDSRARYIVARYVQGAWTVALGIGSRTEPVRGSWKSLNLALRAGRAARRRYIAEATEAIRQQRGGTLDWGMPVAAPAHPRVLIASPGESAYAAQRRDLLLQALPGSTCTRVPVAEMWVNGQGTVPIPAEESTTLATVIYGPDFCPIVVTGDDTVHLLPGWQPNDAVRPSQGRNVSAHTASEIADLARQAVRA